MTDGHVPDSIADHLHAALAPYQPEGLLSRAALRHISDCVCERLPASMTHLYGFECRLWQSEPTADFLVCCGPAPGEWSTLRQLAEGFQDDAWKGVAAFLRGSGAASRPARSEIHNMWLEFDLVEQAPAPHGLPRPSLFFGTEHLRAMAGGDVDGPMAGPDWVMEAVASLRGTVLSAGERRAVTRCLSALPATAKVFQVGMMLSRPSRGLRLCARGWAACDIVSYLDAIGWPGDRQQAVAEIARWQNLVDEIRIDLDFTDDLAPAIGLECYVAARPGAAARVMTLISALEAFGLCLPEKASGLRAWFGITHERRHPALWPAALLARSSALGLGTSSVFRRWIHHFKIGLAPGAPPRAKAYLAVAPAFIADADLKAAVDRAGEQ